MIIQEIESSNGGISSSNEDTASSNNGNIGTKGIYLESEKHAPSSSSEVKHTIPIYKLFSFADRLDIILMIIGTIGAIGNGVSLPLMTVLFGNVINSFGNNSGTDEVIDAVSNVSDRSVCV